MDSRRSAAPILTVSLMMSPTLRIPSTANSAPFSMPLAQSWPATVALKMFDFSTENSWLPCSTARFVLRAASSTCFNFWSAGVPVVLLSSSTRNLIPSPTRHLRLLFDFTKATATLAHTSRLVSASAMCIAPASAVGESAPRNQAVRHSAIWPSRSRDRLNSSTAARLFLLARCRRTRPARTRWTPPGRDARPPWPRRSPGRGRHSKE